MTLSDPTIGTEIKKLVSHFRKLYPKQFNDVEDEVQQVLCSALRLGLPEIGPTYLLNSIRNRLINLSLRHRSSREHLSLDDCNVAGDTPRDTGFDVRRAIDASHVSGVNVMRLYFIDGMTCREIADQTGGTKSAVEGKLKRQINRAKKLLGDYGTNFSHNLN